MDKPFKVFDMKKFQQNMNRELKRPFPDRHKVSIYLLAAELVDQENLKIGDNLDP